MPPNCVYVGRTTKWGNPFRCGDPDPETGDPMTAERAIDLFRRGHIVRGNEDFIRFWLRGMDLACWCPLDGPCHADVLLDIANGTTCHYFDKETA